MAKKSTTTTRTVYKSAETGHFVTKSYATKHPKSTFKQTIKIDIKKPK